MSAIVRHRGNLMGVSIAIPIAIHFLRVRRWVFAIPISIPVMSIVAPVLGGIGFLIRLSHFK